MLVSGTSSAPNRDLHELVSAEDFLEYFGVAYDAQVVQVNRLHILQRFHDYLEGYGDSGGFVPGNTAMYQRYAELLARAYRDFVSSDARSEKVFEVFRRSTVPSVFVSLEPSSK